MQSHAARCAGAVLQGQCAGALVEVWQADSRGDYTQIGAKQDDAGCLLRASLRTGADGRYAFRTVLPDEYPGRPRHIHYLVSAKGYGTLVTQLYFARERGVPQELVVNAAPKDGVLAARFSVRRVCGGGEMKWRGEFIDLTQVLAGEPVGLDPMDERHWRIYF